MIEIVKYKNRKLYNKSTKEYIILRDVADLVRGGREIRVTHHEDNTDITDETIVTLTFLYFYDTLKKDCLEQFKEIIRNNEISSPPEFLKPPKEGEENPKKEDKKKKK